MISLAVTDLLCGIVIPFNTLRFKRLASTTHCIHVLYISPFRWTLGRFMCQFITSAVVILLREALVEQVIH